MALSPLLATSLGVRGHDHEWPDFSPDGIDAERQLIDRYLALMNPHLDHPDPAERLAAAVAVASLGEERNRYEHEDHLYDVSHMASTFESIRTVFDIMDTSTDEAWRNIVARLSTIDRAFAGYRRKLDLALERGRVSSRRQTASLVGQAESLASDSSAFAGLAARAHDGGFDPPGLEGAIDHARLVAGEFAGYLREVYLPHAPIEDGVGEERYRRSAETMVGLDIDPLEAYEWGWEELAALRSEIDRVATDILPGAALEEVVAVLESDPGRAAPSHADFVRFVQARLDDALEQLDGTHFEVPEPVRRVSVNIAPPGGPLGAYYLPPSEDFARPGGVWYSMPPADGPVPLYQEVSTAYHEGFPGHHLQIALVMTRQEHLSRFHRSMVWYPGYGEGWALYTERLMQELGYFEKPDYVLGMLASHVFRAARVVVDIGLHLGLEIPTGAPLHAGARWSYDVAVDYMERVGLQTRDYAESEVLRYLGWPGQAISYKLGEREILDIRSAARRAEGNRFDLKDFHRRILENGTIRLDLLRSLVLGE